MCEILNSIAEMQVAQALTSTQKKMKLRGALQPEIDSALIIKAYYFGQTLDVDHNPFINIDHVLRDDLVKSFDAGKGTASISESRNFNEPLLLDSNHHARVSNF